MPENKFVGHICRLRNGYVTDGPVEYVQNDHYGLRASVNGYDTSWTVDGSYSGLASEHFLDIVAIVEKPPAVHPMCAAMASSAFVPLMHRQEDGTISTASGTVVLTQADGKLYEIKGAICEPLKSALLEDNGDNPNCGKPVERALPPIDESLLPVILRPLNTSVLNDKQAGAWSALFMWCHKHGFDSADKRYSKLTGLQTLAQWILDLKAAANAEPATPATPTAAVGADAPVADSVVEYTDLPDSVKKSMKEVIARKTGIATAPVAPQEDPEEWVMITDPDHIVRKNIDQIRKKGSRTEWDKTYKSVGHPIKNREKFEFRCRRKDLPPVPQQTTVTHGGPYVAREVYDRLRQAAEAVMKASKINDRDFIQHLSGVDSTIVKLRAALVALGDVLREIG